MFAPFDDCSGQAGIATPQHQLVEVAAKPVMPSRRFDRDGAIRIPFLSAMAILGAEDGDEKSSLPLGLIILQQINLA